MPCGLLLVAAFSLVFVAACNKDDDDGNGNAVPTLQLIADNLVAPLTVMEAPDGTKRLFIVDQPGRIWIVKPDGSRRESSIWGVTKPIT